MSDQREQYEPHVVIVDDEPLIRECSAATLAEAGIGVTEFGSGEELLSWLRAGNNTELILLDVVMPEMDGFQTIMALRELEEEQGREEEIPVILLTGETDATAEVRGFALGAIDFIRKPVESYVLLHRIDNVLSKQKQIEKLSEQMQTDPLTGILNKASVTRKLMELCREESGILMVIDLDSFKTVNDIYGHDVGDKVLIAFSDIMKEEFRPRDVLGRIGGDEFIAFLRGATREFLVSDYTVQLNARLLIETRRLLGEEMQIPIGVSVGAAISPGDVDYESLFKRADQELLHVKQTGKHGYRLWKNGGEEEIGRQEANSLQKLRMILDERNVGSEALWLGQEEFRSIYRYMLRFFRRYHEGAFRLLFSVTPREASLSNEEFLSAMTRFGDILKTTLRNSDIMMQSDSSHYLLLLPMVSGEGDIDRVLQRIDSAWEREEDSSRVVISCEKEAIASDDDHLCENVTGSAP